MNLATNAPRRPALRYYGGGWTRARWTIFWMPEHDNYLEPCFGAGSILLRKPVAMLETVNDIDGRVINFFRVLREQTADLLELINLTPWAEDEMRACLKPSEDPLEDARRFFATCWMSVHGGPTAQYASFRAQKSVEGRYLAPPDDAVGRDDLLVTAARLKHVQIYNRDALELIDKFKDEDCLIYFDPPYLPSKRRRKKGYNHEPDEQWHKDAAELLRYTAGPVLVAGYPSKLYKRLYEDHGWTRVRREQQTNGGSKAQECLWLSPGVMDALACEEWERQQGQQSLLENEIWKSLTQE